MGYMTTVTFLNDLWHVIEENPIEFIETIHKGMNGRYYLSNKFSELDVNSYGIQNHCNGIDVAKSHHADDPKLYLVHGNCMTLFNTSNDNLSIAFKKERLAIARQLLRLEADKIKELERRN